MVSLDVESLFTNIPLGDCINLAVKYVTEGNYVYTIIYNTFTNPATSNFAWVGAECAKVLFLNDFRWSPQVLPWHDMLLRLEGQTAHLPAPKYHYAKDIVFETDTAIFCTGKHELVFIKGGCIDERETEMMRVR